MRCQSRFVALAVLFLSSIGPSVANTIHASSPQEPRSALLRKDEVIKRDTQVSRDTEDVRGRPDVGTKDAPVDGQDGKPHAGPFVDPHDPLWHPPESTRETRPGDNLKVSTLDETVPEDGVMNDPNRLPPRRGTTGTEGGVTEKDKHRISHEYSTGEKLVQVPDQPKAADALMDRIIKGSAHEPDKGADTSIGEKLEVDGDEVQSIGGLEKPKDLPETPHSFPIPEPDSLTRETDSQYISKSAHEEDDEDDEDDDDDDDEEEDGMHDIIPWDSLMGSFSSIAATEIGDKTFIVAALMAMRHSRIQVFSAAFSALFVMTILSGIAGHAVGAIISKRWSALVAALLFLVFGAKSLREGFAMSPNQGVSDEIREVEAELEEKEVDMARHANGGRRGSAMSPYALESGRAGTDQSPSGSRSPSPRRRAVKTAVSGIKNLFSLLLSPAWVETFSMTFVGELGDRSQIATVAMAAGQEYFWVMVGASLGHFVCTGVAVLGGSVLAGRVSLRKVTLVGGAIFIGFGFFTLLEALQYWS